MTLCPRDVSVCFRKLQTRYKCPQHSSGLFSNLYSQVNPVERTDNKKHQQYVTFTSSEVENNKKIFIILIQESLASNKAVIRTKEKKARNSPY